MNSKHCENRFGKIHWRLCLRRIYSSGSRSFMTLPKPMNPMVFSHELAYILQPRTMVLFQSTQEGLDWVIPCYSKTYYSAHWLLPLFYCFLYLLLSTNIITRMQASGEIKGAKSQLKELSHNCVIVATTEQTQSMFG